jgi:hypothetical protein
MIGDSPHTKATPIIKHKAKVIMNLNNYTYIRRKRGGKRGSYALSPSIFSIVYVSEGRLS